jgi:ParB family chromosome partitioning protein
MSIKKDRKGLGRGLSALMADIQPTETGPAQAAVAPRPAEQSVPVEQTFPKSRSAAPRVF